MMQCDAVCRSVLQCVAGRCIVLQFVQCVAVCCSVLQCVARHIRKGGGYHVKVCGVWVVGTLQHVAVCCNVLQCVAV